MTSNAQGFPAPNAPIADPGTGNISPLWWRLLLTLWNRTGGAISIDDPLLLALCLSDGGIGQQSGGSGGYSKNPVHVTLGASPFAYTAPSLGTAVLSGGGVAALSVKRSGVTAPVGSHYAPVALSAFDVLTITYTTAPTLWFLPT